MSNYGSDEMIEGFQADPAGHRIADLERRLSEQQNEFDAQGVVIAGLEAKLNAAVRDRDEQKRRCEKLEKQLRAAAETGDGGKGEGRRSSAAVQLELKDQQLRELRRQLEDIQFQQRRSDAALKQAQQVPVAGSIGSKVLNDRLLEARARITELEAETEPMQLHIQGLEDELATARNALEQEKKGHATRVSALQQEVAKLQSKIADTPLRELRKRKNEAEEAASRLQAELAERDERLHEAAREQRRLEDLLQDRGREHDSLTEYLARVEEKLEKRTAQMKEVELEREQAELAYKAVQDQLEGRHVRSATQPETSGRKPTWGLLLVGLVLGALASFGVLRWSSLGQEVQSAQFNLQPRSAPAVTMGQPASSAPAVAVASPDLAEPELPAEAIDLPDSPPPAGPEAQELPFQPAEPSAPAVPVEAVSAPVEPTSAIARDSLRDPLRSGGQGPEMIGLQASSFQMGSEHDVLAPEEAPPHEVRLGDFYIGRYEVSFAEYDRFARATGRGLPRDEGWGRGDRPVIHVSWDDARAYAQWLSGQTGQTYRLPSEAEWEYAARAGVETFYWWGYKPGRNNANCFDCGSQWDGARTAPVGSFEANPFGLHDTAGNVMEWVADCYNGNYEGAPNDGSPWLEGDCSRRGARGGAYNKPVERLRGTRRGGLAPSSRLSNLGFRLVREP